MSNFKKIKEAVNIFDVVGSYISISNKKGICPFHDDDNPSLHLTDKLGGRYTCFSCGAKGDVIDFVANYEGVSTMQAVNILAKDYGIDIEVRMPKPKSYQEKPLAVYKFLKSIPHTKEFDLPEIKNDHLHGLHMYGDDRSTEFLTSISDDEFCVLTRGVDSLVYFDMEASLPSSLLIVSKHRTEIVGSNTFNLSRAANAAKFSGVLKLVSPMEREATRDMTRNTVVIDEFSIPILKEVLKELSSEVTTISIENLGIYTDKMYKCMLFLMLSGFMVTNCGYPLQDRIQEEFEKLGVFNPANNTKEEL